MEPKIENLIAHEKKTSLGKAFVDDTNTFVIEKHLDTQDKVLKETYEQLMEWRNLWRVTGGDVKYKRSFWWLLIW